MINIQSVPKLVCQMKIPDIRLDFILIYPNLLQSENVS